MKELAILHEEAIRKLFYRHAHDPKYMYYWNYSYRSKYTAPESTWEKVEYAILLEDGSVGGLVGYSTERNAMVADSLAAINFTCPPAVFAHHLLELFTEMFVTFSFRKCRWTVCVGNPAEAHYDRLVEKLGGRIVGVFEKEDKLLDGSYTDRKMYEVMRDNYMEAIKRERIFNE